MIVEDNTHVVHGPKPLQPLLDISLGKLLYDALLANTSNRLALVDAISKNSLSYSDLFEASCSLAESLRRSGYGKNTIVSISSENSICFFIPVIASLYLGCIIAPVNHNYTEYETTHTLDICKPRVVFCSKSTFPKFASLKKKLQYIEKIIIIDDETEREGAETMTSLISRKVTKFELEKVEPKKQLALILCSSGTTGLPKGVMLTHTNLMVRYMHSVDSRYMPDSDCFLAVLPFFHIYGFLTNLFSLVLAHKIIVLQKFEEELFLQTIQEYKISALWLVPPLIVFLEKSPLVECYDLSFVKDIISGAAPLSKETEEAVKKRLNIPSVRQGYGLTETPLAVTLMSSGDVRPGSTGKVVSYASCKVRDPKTGKSLKANEIGELCFKGPMIMKGYYKNEAATKHAFTADRWFLTGDLGYYDNEEYFYVVDRLKELIKYKGFQVAPAELEAVILTNQKVQDVAVVGLPDKEAGELPLAFVVKKDKTLTEKEIIELVAEKVSFQKRLRGGVVFVTEIPKNASGKILRRKLRDLLKTHRAKL